MMENFLVFDIGYRITLNSWLKSEFGKCKIDYIDIDFNLYV